MTEKKQKSKISRWVVIAVASGALAWGVWYFTRLTMPVPGDEAAWIYIPKGATAEAARDSIISGLGDTGYGRRVASLWSGDAAKSRGAYRIEPGTKAWQAAKWIGEGRQTPVRVTFNNVRTFDQLAERLSARMDFSAGEFKDVAIAVRNNANLTNEAFEAQFLPDTYEAYWTASPEELIAKIRQNYLNFWNDKRTDSAGRLGLSPLEVSVLASIVEEESNKVDERGKIARLYLNRLHKGMKLQADPTVKFAGGDFTVKRITGDMLKIRSPYNTYLNEGLPPGIIRLPEARTLDAVLNAPEHDYIYMCARPDGSGYHDFTSSYDRHLANARAFRKAAYGAK